MAPMFKVIVLPSAVHGLDAQTVELFRHIEPEGTVEVRPPMACSHAPVGLVFFLFLSFLFLPAVRDSCWRWLPSDLLTLFLFAQPGFCLDVSGKAWVWQVKARLMEFTGVPPISANLSLTSQSKPLLVSRLRLFFACPFFPCLWMPRIRMRFSTWGSRATLPSSSA